MGGGAGLSGEQVVAVRVNLTAILRDRFPGDVLPVPHRARSAVATAASRAS